MKISLPKRANAPTLPQFGWVCADDLERPNYCPGESATCGSGSPVAETLPATNVGSSSVMLMGSVNPNGSATEGWFEWDTQSAGPLAFATSRRPLGSGAAPVSLSETLGGLLCGTTYYFRALGESLAGRAEGTPRAFATTSCSGGGSGSDLIVNGGFENGSSGWTRSGNFYVDGLSCPYAGSWYTFLALADGTPGDNLVGWIQQDVDIPSNVDDAELSFRYSISTQETSTAPWDVLNVTVQATSGGSIDTVRVLSNLDALNLCGQAGYRRVTYDLTHRAGQRVRIRFLGTTDSRTGTPTVFRVDDVKLLVTTSAGLAPAVATNPATNLTQTSARLNLSVNPNGRDTEVWFEWDDDTNLSFETDPVEVGDGSAPVAVGASLYDLDCGTRYYFQAFAENSEGSVSGSTNTFDTVACPPVAPRANSGEASQVTGSTVVLMGGIRPYGSPTEGWFEWGPTPSLGLVTPRRAMGSGLTWVPLNESLTGLECNKTYYFRAWAQSSAGSAVDSTLTFRTAGCGTGVLFDGLLLSSDGVSCNGAAPAVLLRWSMPPGADPVVTVRRTDGQYAATVDTSVLGPVHPVLSGMEVFGVYGFYVEATISGSVRTSNVEEVLVLHEECRMLPTPGDPLGRPLAWAGLPYCENGQGRVQLNWMPVPGAEWYRVHAYDFGSDPDLNQRLYDNLTGSSVVDTAVRPARFTEYTIYAVNATTSRPVSQIVITPNDLCGATVVPGPFTTSATAPNCDADGKGNVNLTWTASAGAGSYQSFFWDIPYTYGGGTGADPIPGGFESSVDGLRLGRVYRFIVRAKSSADPTNRRFGTEIQRYIPLDLCGAPTRAPEVTSTAPVYVSETSAMLRGTVVPNGAPTNGRFEYGLSASYSLSTPMRYRGGDYRISRSGEVVNGLACGTTYHFRHIAWSALGVTAGDDLSFTTDPCENDAPLARQDAYTTAPGSLLTVPAPGVLLNDSDEDGDALWVASAVPPRHGILALAADGGFSYTPTPDFIGDVGFSYVATDGAALSPSTAVTISVRSSPTTIFGDGFEVGSLDVWSGSRVGGGSGSPNVASSSLNATLHQSFVLTDAAQNGLDIVGDMTIEFWMRPAAEPGNFQLVGKYQESAGMRSYGIQYVLDGTIKTVAFTASSDCSAETVSYWPVDLGTGTWRHLALVYTATAGSAELFVDGVSLGVRTEPPTALCNGTASFTIGQRENARYYDGLLDEVRIWNSARTVSAIGSNRSLEIPCDTPGLVSYWRLNSDAEDCTARANHLTPVNGPTYSPSVPFP